MCTDRPWAAAGNERAIARACAASTECSRRRVERAEGAARLADRAAQRRGDDRHTAVSPAGHPARATARSH